MDASAESECDTTTPKDETVMDKKRSENAESDSALDIEVQRFYFALEAAEIGAWDMNLKDQKAWRSLRHDQIFGYETLLDTWTYEIFLSHVLPEDRAYVDERFQSAMVRHGDWGFECRIRRADGQIRWIWAKGRHQHDEEGNPVRMLGLVQDFTEQKLAQENKLKAVGQLAGGIAHDFNNILSILVGNLSTLAEMEGLPEEAKTLCRELDLAAMRGRSLTRQLLTFATGGVPVKEASNLREVAEETVRFALSGSSVTFRSQLRRDLPAVEMDAGQISQVFQNLAINAVQAIPQGGEVMLSGDVVEISCESGLPIADGRYICITVADDGPGIPPDALPSIFNPFFTTRKEGSGLGLATSYAIIKKHGGHIEAMASREGGASFVIYLPASEKALPKAVDPRLVQQMPRARVLVMDDEAGIRNIARMILAKAGLRVDVASEGNQALALHREAMAHGDPYALLILDLTIPGGLGGQEVVRRLRQGGDNVFAIASSGYSTDPRMGDFSSCGFSSVLPKPYRRDDLLAAVYAVLTEESSL